MSFLAEWSLLFTNPSLATDRYPYQGTFMKIRLALAVAAGLLATDRATAELANLVPNGDFETLALDEFDQPTIDAYGNSVPVSWFRAETTPDLSPTQPVELIPDDDSDGVGTNSFALNFFEQSVGPISFPGSADMRSNAFEALAGETLTWSFDFKFLGADQAGGDEFRGDLRFFEDLSPTDPASTGSAFIFEDQYLSGSDGAEPDGVWASIEREFVVPFDSPDTPDDDGRPAAGTVVYGDVRISINAFTAFEAGSVLIDNVRVTRPISADFNGDGVVDAADYTVWRNTEGSTTDLRADATADGVVGAEDYDRWAFEFGSSDPGQVATGVPEPAAVFLALAVVAGRFVSSRR